LANYTKQVDNLLSRCGQRYKKQKVIEKMSVKLKKGLCVATFALVATGCASTLQTKEPTTTFEDPNTGLKFDTVFQQAKSQIGAEQHCADSNTYRQELKNLRESGLEIEARGSRERTFIEKGTDFAAEKKNDAEYYLAQGKFERATQACAQGAAATLATKGDFACAFKNGGVYMQPEGTTPKTILQCVTGGSSKERNYLARWQETKAGAYADGGKYYKTPSKIK